MSRLVGESVLIERRFPGRQSRSWLREKCWGIARENEVDAFEKEKVEKGKKKKKKKQQRREEKKNREKGIKISGWGFETVREEKRLERKLLEKRSLRHRFHKREKQWVLGNGKRI